MKASSVAAFVLFVATAAPSLAHGTETPCAVIASTRGAQNEAIVRLDAFTYGYILNGLVYCKFGPISVGSTFAVAPDDGQTPFVVGTASVCPGPRPPEDYDSGLPTEGTPADPLADLVSFWLDDPGNNVELYCENWPDLEAWFLCEDGEVVGPVLVGVAPCSGWLYVFVFGGDPGESVTYHEGF